LSLSNPALNLTFSLLPITSSHPHASASDSTFDYWRYINIWLTLTLTGTFWRTLYVLLQLWANDQETRDNLSLISYAGCLCLSPVISAKIHS